MVDTPEAVVPYLAGIFDGEGYVSIVENRHKGKHQLVMRAGVGMTDFIVPLMLYEIYGGTITESPPSNPKWKPKLVWTIYARKAEAFLKEIQPYVRVKSYQVEVALRFQASKGVRGVGLTLTDEERAIQEAEKILMNQLNQRGVII